MNDVALPPERIRGKVMASVVVALLASAIVAHHEACEPPYLMADKAVATAPLRSLVRVHGYVQDLQHFPGDVHRFKLAWNGACLDTEVYGILPDTMREHSEVVVGGQLEASGDHWVLVGTQLWARCNGKYEGDPRSRIDTDFK